MTRTKHLLMPSNSRDANNLLGLSSHGRYLVRLLTIREYLQLLNAAFTRAFRAAKTPHTATACPRRQGARRLPHVSAPGRQSFALVHMTVHRCCSPFSHQTTLQAYVWGSVERYHHQHMFRQRVESITVSGICLIRHPRKVSGPQRSSVKVLKRRLG